MKRLIIVGSPRTNGRSAHLAEMLFEANIDEHPEDELFLVPLSEVDVGPCVGCNACRAMTPVTYRDDEGNEVTRDRHRCVFDDDMQTLYDLIDEVDEVVLVTPVYFSGAPSQLKCLLDRLQPYFWARLEARERGALPPKRPLVMHVLGEGGDPHGYGALRSEVTSAFQTADFRLERILDWVGKIDASGEILQEAEEIVLVGASGPSPVDAGDGQAGDLPAEGSGEVATSVASGGAPGSTARKPRPRLDLSASAKSAGKREATGKRQTSAGDAGGSRKPGSGAKGGGRSGNGAKTASRGEGGGGKGARGKGGASGGSNKTGAAGGSGSRNGGGRRGR